MIKKYKRIMLVVNGGNDVAAISHSLRLAKRNKGSILVVKVINSLTKMLEIANSMIGRIFDIRKNIVTEMKAKVQSKIKESDSQTRIAYKLLEGTRFFEITRTVVKNKIDLLVISDTDKKQIGGYFLSSTILNLLRKCPCPVWISKPSSKDKLSNIMVALDIDPDDEVKTNLNIDLMKNAIDLARAYRVPLYVLYVWHLYGEEALRNSPFIKVKKSEVDQMSREAKKKNTDALNAFISDFDISGIKLVPTLIKGSPVNIIPKFVTKNKINLVVMGTVCRVGLPGFLIGNTAEEILRNIRCSVLTIKPKGFVSEIE